jgi:hypothetical protein
MNAENGNQSDSLFNTVTTKSSNETVQLINSETSSKTAFFLSLFLWIVLIVILAENWIVARKYDHRLLCYTNAFAFLVVLGMLFALLYKYCFLKQVGGGSTSQPSAL